MTLREKFLPKMYCFFGSGIGNTIYDGRVVERNAKECEKIADEFAIEFAEWLKDKPRSQFNRESLEQFKKETGL
jgi:hypothetical protein